MADIPTGEEARDWIAQHPAKMLAIDLAWKITEETDDGAYNRLLEILFSPRPGDRAA